MSHTALARRLGVLAPQMVQGSLAWTSRTCGKAGCRCHPGAKHGPDAFVTFRQPDGRPGAFDVPQGSEPEVRAAGEAVAPVRAGNAEQVVSFVDPEARWGATSDPKGSLGSKVHRALDPDSQLSSDVETCRVTRTRRSPSRGCGSGSDRASRRGALSIGDGL